MDPLPNHARARPTCRPLSGDKAFAAGADIKEMATLSYADVGIAWRSNKRCSHDARKL